MYYSETYDDLALLEQLKNGNEQAFRILYERYHKVLFRNVIRILHNEEDARDIIQEVFITLWENRGILEINRPINGWLFTLSYNRTVNYLKRNLRTQIKLAKVSNQLDLPPNEEMEECDYALLQEAINKLSPQKKKVFELCKLQGKTYDKVASDLGLSKYTVGEYLQDAMAFLREYVRKRQATKYL